MKAVFLDTAMFSKDLDMPKPDGITDYQTFDSTPPDPDVVVDRCKNADIIITNKVRLSREIIERLPNLKLIQLTATGTDNVDARACNERNVALFNVVGYGVKSVPEHTIMLMLNSLRAAIYYHSQVIDGAWRRDGRFCLSDVPIIDLENKSLGIIGVGTIGKRVSELARAFHMTVLWAERRGRQPRSSEYLPFEYVLAESDIIALHCPLNDESFHLINDDAIALMTKKPLIVNVARGKVVDPAAIANAIENDSILGYASDVFEQEPIANDDPLLRIKDHHRVFFTPHNAWGSIHAQKELWNIVCRQVSDFIGKNS